MLAFGVIGIVLAAIMSGALIAGGVAARNLDERVLAAQAQVGASLTRLTLSMDSLATSIDNASTTLETSRDAAVHAADTIGSLADATASLASALDISILGQQPFTGTVAKLHELEANVRVFQDDATKLAANLDQNASDVTQIANQLRDIRSQVAELAGAVTGFANTRDVVSLAVGGIVLGGLLTAWEAVLALGIAWMGLRLRRIATVSATPAAAPSPGPAGDATAS